MSSKRAIRRRQCRGKQRFADADAARSAIRSLMRAHGWNGSLTPYLCRWCKGWHFGHTPGQGWRP